MQTNDLIAFLATGVDAVDVRAARSRHIKAFALAVAGQIGLMIILLRARSDLLDVIADPMLWFKLGFAACLAGAGYFAFQRFSRPGTRSGGVLASVASPVALIGIIAVAVLYGAVPEERDRLLFGQTWKVCPFLITLLSVPVFVCAVKIMREMAPVRLRLAGFSAGLFAGGTAALAYSLHCPEMGIPFIGVWYTLGIFLPAIVGAMLGDRLLRW